MKLENQVCTLPQAKRLKELGVTAQSVNKWYQSSVSAVLLYSISDEPYLDNEWFAYSVAELGAMMTSLIGTSAMIDPIVEKYGDNINTMWNPLFLADCIIYLLENNVITAADCNARLSDGDKAE